MPDFSIAISLLRKPIDELYLKVDNKELKQRIAVIRSAAKVKLLHKRLYESQRVKTIWHTDRPLSLTSFFYPVRIVKNDPTPTNPIRLKNLEPFKNNHNIIFGTVGQGKSILLRYLLGSEIRSGTRIPVFIELRNADKKALWEYLVDKFASVMGVAPDDELFTLFSSEGKVSILLDGFDEVEPGNVAKLMLDIEELSYKCPDCKIILTSRPDSDCKHLTNFHSYKIQPLNHEDLLGFYKKITKDSEFSARIHSAIKASPTKIRELVTTPLLATLLAISYRSAQKIPLGFSEFYDELFQILLIRHDASKLGWRRHRKSKLDDRQIQHIFEAFCFSTRKKQLTSIDQEVAYQIAVESIGEVGFEAEPQPFLDDIRKITCLLIEEGKKMAFVHASVQEFFAARYIKTRTDIVAQRFYAQVLNSKWPLWPEELNFLRQIDSHRAVKYFYIPDGEKTISYILGDQPSVTNDVAIAYLKLLKVVKKPRTTTSAEKYVVEKMRSNNNFKHLSSIDTQVFSKMFTWSPETPEWMVSFHKNPTSTERTYYDIVVDRGEKFEVDLIKYVVTVIETLQKDLIRMKGLVAKHEEESEFMDLS